MFQLTRAEVESLSWCKKRTTIQTKGVRGGSPYLPYAFTEQGVYMLMTVLHGDEAVHQSRALVMAFKSMKDYISAITEFSEGNVKTTFHAIITEMSENPELVMK